MGGDRRRTHSIEVPMPLTPQNNPRKRPPSYTNEEDQCNKVEMDECNAALILMKLSNSPKSPRNGDVWHVSSPYSSSASWSSGSSSPPLSDDGIALLHTNATMLQDASASARLRTISVSTSDEGIDVDFKDDVPRKKRANKSRFKCTYRGCNYTESIQTKIERHIRHAHLGNKKPRRSADESDHEEEFYYTEVEEDDEDVKPSPTSPTLSHRDMARPPHEDPEYQRQIVGNFKNGRVTSHQQPHLNGVVRSIQHGSPGQQYHQVQNHHQQQLQNNNTICMATSPLAHHNYTWPSSIASNNNSTTIVAPTSPHQQQQHSNTLMHHQPTQLHHNGSATLIKRVHPSPRPSQTVAAKAPYPSPPPPAYVQHQLSQQNVTVTVTTSPNQHQHQHQQSPHHQQISTGAITITPTTTNAANINNNNNNNNNSNNNNNNYQTHQQQIHQHNQQQQQQQHQQSQHHSIHHMQQHSPNPNNNMLNGNNAQQQHVLQQQHHHQHQQQHQHQHQQQQHQHQHHTAAINNSTKQAPNSGGNANSPPNRRTRGENKKCRKVYGMLRREQWCTQCKWKKACSRFGD